MMLLVICQLIHDVIGYEDSKCHWCISIQLLLQFNLLMKWLLGSNLSQFFVVQRAKKIVSDSPGLVDFAIGLVNSVINLPEGQVKFSKEFKLQKNCEINLLIKTFLGLVEVTSGLVNVSFSFPEWQAVKMTFFAPCCVLHCRLKKRLIVM